MPDFDLAVIGAGAAGLSVAAGAAQLGAHVVLIERGRMGGDCLSTGCVPSKALLSVSRAARAGRPIGWDQVRASIQEVIADIAPADSAERFRALGATVLMGEARFLNPDTLVVDGRQITARRFVIAAGSRAAVPAIQGLDEIPYWTNESLFDLAERPDHLLILGGGPVGLEMADAFSGLGCLVTVVQAGRIAEAEDPELAAGLRRALAARGVVFREGALVTRVARGPVLILANGTRVEGSHLLIAAGRLPNLAALDLPAGNIATGPAGIATDRGLRSRSNRRVFAVGDIADPAGLGPRALTHVGSYHASVVIRRILLRLPARLDYAALPRVIYTDPELAQTGMTEAEAVAAGLKPRVLRWPLAGQRPRHRRTRYRWPSETGGHQPAHCGSRHPGAARRGDDKPLESRDRSPYATFDTGWLNRALSNAVRGWQTRCWQLLRPVVVFCSYESNCAFL